MSKKTISIIVVVVIAFLCFNGCSTYNSFVKESESVDKTWADVEVQYQRRFDLIPNLVETVKAYAKHESETFENVTKARAGLSDAYNQAKGLEGTDMSTAESFDKYNSAQQDLSKAFNIYVNAVKEAYPELKADKQFQDLQVQLEGTENRIATERRNYTEQVQKYNLNVKKFPGKLWASVFGFEPKVQFKADEDAQKAPKLSF